MFLWHCAVGSPLLAVSQHPYPVELGLSSPTCAQNQNTGFEPTGAAAQSTWLLDFTSYYVSGKCYRAIPFTKSNLPTLQPNYYRALFLLLLSFGNRRV